MGTSQVEVSHNVSKFLFIAPLACEWCLFTLELSWLEDATLTALKPRWLRISTFVQCNSGMEGDHRIGYTILLREDA